LLVPPRDVRALTDKLLWLVSDGALRSRLAAQGQREAYARYNRDQVIEQIESLYLELLDVEEVAYR
jgi:glycosyltransferase involved in cell wall biosynthesis